jgi:uncharacterized repeat protein (TIGR03847 family)
MTESFELIEPERFVAGAEGPPGQRVFYLQAVDESQVMSLRLEKQQVAALCDYLAGILDDLPTVPAETTPTAELVGPVEPAWVVGTLAVAYEQSADRILVVAEEAVDPDELVGDDEPATAQIMLSRRQVSCFVHQAMEVVRAGRPPCVLCNQPIDPNGHVCPRWN